jgi:hypothetical protein
MFQFYSSLVYTSRLLLHAFWVLFQEANTFKNTKTHKNTQSQDVTRVSSKKAGIVTKTSRTQTTS